MSASHCSGFDNVQDALQAMCDALITLESIGASPPDGRRDPGISVHVARAITSLRRAVSDLRRAQGADVSAVSLGFVLDASPRRRSG